LLEETTESSEYGFCFGRSSLDEREDDVHKLEQAARGDNSQQGWPTIILEEQVKAVSVHEEEPVFVSECLERVAS